MKALTDAAKAEKAAGIATVDGYEATYFTFADSLCPKRWSGPTAFQACGFAIAKLNACNAASDLQTWAHQAVVWTDKRMSSPLVFAALADAFKAFEQTWPDLTAHATLLARTAMPSEGDIACPFTIRDKADLQMFSKALMVLGDDRKMCRQAGYAPMYLQRPDPTTGVKAPKRQTLLIDEVLRLMNAFLSGVSGEDIDWQLFDKVLLACLCISMKGSVTVYVNARLRQRPSVVIVADAWQLPSTKAATYCTAAGCTHRISCASWRR